MENPQWADRNNQKDSDAAPPVSKLIRHELSVMTHRRAQKSGQPQFATSAIGPTPYARTLDQRPDAEGLRICETQDHKIIYRTIVLFHAEHCAFPDTTEPQTRESTDHGQSGILMHP